MAEAPEFQDWDLLHDTETGNAYPSEVDFVEIDAVSDGIIRSDYFASDSLQRYASTVDDPLVEEEVEEGSVSSDNPSWIEPCSDNPRKISGELWSDSSCDESKVSDFDGKQDLGVEGIGEIGEFNGGNEEFHKFWSDSGGEASVQEQEEEEGVVDEVLADETVSDGGGAMASSEGEKKGMVWWKLPFEILKFCLFKVSPGWSIAVAAAVMGIVILRRRLMRMKRKSRGLPLKITVDDKKVSQFMINAARLNEAFSVVRRVPMIRPLLPTPGLTPWPVMNLR